MGTDIQATKQLLLTVLYICSIIPVVAMIVLLFGSFRRSSEDTDEDILDEEL